jgi:hypothetical protein
MIRKATFWLIRVSNLQPRPRLHTGLLWVSRLAIFFIVFHTILSVFLSDGSVFLDLSEGFMLLGIVIATPCWLWLFLDWIYRKDKVFGKLVCGGEQVGFPKRDSADKK